MSGLGVFPARRGGSDSEEEERAPRSPPHRVKRALFGPTDHEENLRFVRNEMKKAKNEAANRWNFDFDAGTPLKGRYDWEAARPGSLHAVYNLDRLPFLGQQGEGLESVESVESKENRVEADSALALAHQPVPTCDDLRTPEGGTSPSPDPAPAPALQPSHSSLPPPPAVNPAASGDTSRIDAKEKQEKKITGETFADELIACPTKHGDCCKFENLICSKFFVKLSHIGILSDWNLSSLVTHWPSQIAHSIV